MSTRSITPNPPADFTPDRQPQIQLQPFRFWCQKVLPLVYDDALSYYELLCKVVDYLNKTMEDVSNMDVDMSNMYNAYNELQSYVNDYFSTLDVQQEIDNKLDEMVIDGTFYNLFYQTFYASVYPTIVDSTEDMVDETKTYVLSTNGHIYQYRSASFVDTGLVYNGVANNTMIYKNIDNADLNNIVNIGVYIKTSLFTEEITNAPENTNTNNFILLVASNDTNSYIFQIFSSIRDDKFYIRKNIANIGWGEWYCINSVYDFNKFMEKRNNAQITDLNNIEDSMFYFNANSNEVLNLPPNVEYNAGCIISLTNASSGSSQKYQVLLPFKAGTIYYRYYSSPNWSEWVNIRETFSDSDISITVNNKSIYVNIGYDLELLRVTNETYKQDNYTLSNVSKNGVELINDTTDLIGPIRLANDNSFIGGIHGYEIVTNIHINLDGENLSVDENNSYTGKILNVTIITDLYSTSDLSTPSLTRIQNLRFKRGEISIINSYKTLKEITVVNCDSGGAMCILNNQLIGIVTPVSSMYGTYSRINSKYIKNTVFITTCGTIEHNLLHITENGEYNGDITTYDNKTKIYFWEIDDVNGVVIPQNSVMSGNFIFKFE